MLVLQNVMQHLFIILLRWYVFLNLAKVFVKIIMNDNNNEETLIIYIIYNYSSFKKS